MKKSLMLSLVIVLAATLVLSACGGQKGETQGAGDHEAGKTYEFKLVHVVQPTHVWNKTAEKLKEELEQRSNGRMKLTIFPAAQLGTEKDYLQQLQTGSVEFGMITSAFMSTSFEEFNAWFMPFLFADLKEATEARSSESAKAILGTLEQHGLVGLDFVFAGNRHILMKGKPVTTPEDLKGKKFRIIGSPAIMDFWEAVGTGPAPMPLAEVFTALQTGVIDGIDIDFDALMTEKYYEIAKDLTITNHMTFNAAVVMSKAVYDRLSPEDQQMIRDAVKAACDWGAEEAVRMEEENFEALKNAGVRITELENAESFRAVRDQIYEKYSRNPIIKAFIEEHKK